MPLHPSIVRAYDIRGVIEETLFPQDAYAIGQALGTYTSRHSSNDSPRVCVGFDGRLSSPELEESLVKGLQTTGAEVIRVGRGPTPMLYYSTQLLEADAGVMITGSHNPPNHNGFKMMVGKLPLFGEQIEEIAQLIAANDFKTGHGSVYYENIEKEYLERLLHSFDSSLPPLKIAWDAGNGAAGEILEKLVSHLPGEHIVINSEIDGTFPAHHPDPSVPENLEQIAEIVKKEQCDLGLAFDGDADRVGAVDNLGRMISGDHLMMLFSRYILSKVGSGTIIADVKTSQLVFDDIAAHGGTPMMWKTGHSLIKTKMAEIEAVFAGEMSGHIFFKEHFGFDDGLYAALQMVNITAGTSQPLSNVIDTLPICLTTPETRIDVPEARKFVIIDEVKARMHGQKGEVDTIDGLRVTHPYGWWLLRASNTQAALVARCESKTEEGLEKLKAELCQQLAESAIEHRFEIISKTKAS